MSKFCSNCGCSIADDLRVCTYCGAEVEPPVNNQQPPYGQQGYEPYGQPMYVVQNPLRPGRSLGIAGMVLAIIGFVYAFPVLLMILVANSEVVRPVSFLFEMFTGPFIEMFVVFASMSIMGIAFGISAKNKGYNCGVSTSGVALGSIGVVLYLLSSIYMICA